MREKITLVVGVVLVVWLFGTLVVRGIAGAAWGLRESDPQSRRMRDAETDDHRCDDCRSVTAVRELLTRGDACVLLCARCADLAKMMQARPRRHS